MNAFGTFAARRRVIERQRQPDPPTPEAAETVATAAARLAQHRAELAACDQQKLALLPGSPPYLRALKRRRCVLEKIRRAEKKLEGLPCVPR